MYLAESEDVCRGEVARRIEPDTTLSFGMLEIELEAVCDLTDPAVRQALGITYAALVGDDWSITQGIGRALRDAGFEGLIAPSAAGVRNPGRLQRPRSPALIHPGGLRHRSVEVGRESAFTNSQRKVL